MASGNRDLGRNGAPRQGRAASGTIHARVCQRQEGAPDEKGLNRCQIGVNNTLSIHHEYQRYIYVQHHSKQ